MPRWPKTREEQFWQKVSKAPGFGRDGTCWSWIGATAAGGYGVKRDNAGTIKAHRLSFEIHNGSIPKGLHVLHSCDNPKCVNPDHLRAGTQLENIADKVVRNRSRNGRENTTHCPQGHEYTPGNTYICKRNQRSCKACNNVREKADRQAKRERQHTDQDLPATL